MTKLKAKLEKADSIFKKARERAESAPAGDDQWEDGRYVVKLMKAELTQSQNDNRMVVLTYKGLEGEYKGKETKDYRVV